MKKKKLTGAEIQKRVSKQIDKTGIRSVVTGIGCGEPFGILVRFENTKLHLFLGFDKVYYVKDLTEEKLEETISDVKFYTDQITVKDVNNSTSEAEDLADL